MGTPKADCEDSGKNSCDGLLSALRREVAELKQEVAELKRELQTLKTAVAAGRDGLGDDESEETLPESLCPGVLPPVTTQYAPEPDKRSSIQRSEFARRRDDMVHLWERFWPEIEWLLSKTGEKEATAFTDGLRLMFPGKVEWEPLASVLRQPDAVRDILAHPDIPNQPRQIAYALTGLPDMVPRSSLARCRREPCPRLIDPRAMRAHIRFAHARWYGKYERRGLSKRLISTLPKDCPHCARYKPYAEALRAVLEEQPHTFVTQAVTL